MKHPIVQRLGAALGALWLIAAGGCASFHHSKTKKPHCPEPAISSDVKNMPPLRVPTGLDAPDTRNAIKVPTLTEPEVARLDSEPCLSSPPSFGKQLAAYTGPSSKQKGQWDWYVNGGAAFPMGKASSLLNTGWTLGGGVSYKTGPVSKFSWMLDVSYSDFNASYNLISLGQQKVLYSIDGGTGDVWAVTAKGKYTTQLTSNLFGYAALGLGAYKQSLKLTESALVGTVVCDWWGYCYTVAHEGDVVIASRSTTKLGWTAALGLEIPVRSGRSAWFFETGYTSVQGHNSIQFLPLQVGYRF